MPDETNTPPLPEFPAETKPQSVPPETAETPPKNEPAATGNATDKNTVGAKIRRASAAVFEKAGIMFKAGRGRPKNCESCGGAGCATCNFTGKQPNKSAVPISQGDDAGGGPAAAEPVAEAEKLAAKSEMSLDQINEQLRKMGLPAVSNDRFAVAAGNSGNLTSKSIVGTVRGVLSAAKAIVKTKMRRAGLDKQFIDRAEIGLTEGEAEALKEFSDSLEIVCVKRGVNLEYAPELNCISAAARLATPYWVLIGDLNAEIERRKRAGQ